MYSRTKRFGLDFQIYTVTFHHFKNQYKQYNIIPKNKSGKLPIQSKWTFQNCGWVKRKLN